MLQYFELPGKNGLPMNRRYLITTGKAPKRDFCRVDDGSSGGSQNRGTRCITSLGLQRDYAQRAWTYEAIGEAESIDRAGVAEGVQSIAQVSAMVSFFASCKSPAVALGLIGRIPRSDTTVGPERMQITVLHDSPR